MHETNENWAISTAIELAQENIRVSTGISDRDLCMFIEYVYNYLLTGKLPDESR